MPQYASQSELTCSNRQRPWRFGADTDRSDRGMVVAAQRPYGQLRFKRQRPASHWPELASDLVFSLRLWARKTGGILVSQRARAEGCRKIMGFRHNNLGTATVDLESQWSEIEQTRGSAANVDQLFLDLQENLRFRQRLALLAGDALPAWTKTPSDGKGK